MILALVPAEIRPSNDGDSMKHKIRLPVASTDWLCKTKEDSRRAKTKVAGVFVPAESVEHGSCIMGDICARS